MNTKRLVAVALIVPVLFLSSCALIEAGRAEAEGGHYDYDVPSAPPKVTPPPDIPLGGGDAAFLSSLRDYADFSDVAIEDSMLSDADFLAYAHRMCVRAEGGENWEDVYFAEAQPIYVDLTDTWTIDTVFLLKDSVLIAASTICPDQYATALRQFTPGKD